MGKENRLEATHEEVVGAARRQAVIYRQMFGEKTEAGYARLYFRPGGEPGKTLIAGSLLGDLPLTRDGEFLVEEMWECEVIIIPRRRWRDNRATHLRGCRIDQVLNGRGLDETLYREAVPVETHTNNREQTPVENPARSDNFDWEGRRR